MKAVSTLNAVLTKVFDLFFSPFANLDPIWAMVAISLVTGVLMLWIFGLVSNQAALRETKEKIRGNLLAIRLYRHDVRVVLQTQGRLLLLVLRYMKYSLIPMLILIIPVLFIIIQLHLRFEHRPLAVGESTLIKVKVRDADLMGESVSLHVPEGIQVETPAVRIPSKSEVAWRLRPSQAGLQKVTVEIDGDRVEKEISIGSGWGKVSPLRTGHSIWDLLLYSGEPPIKASAPIREIEVIYPSLPLKVFGWNIHWLVLFFVLSIVFGFAFKKPFGIEI